MSKELASAIQDILKPQFPFRRLLNEVPSINQRLGLTGGTAFSEELKPVFFVGNVQAAPRFLLVGLKPGLGADSKPSFRAERRALASQSFDTYWRSRLDYFQSNAFNGNHYSPIAKLLGSVGGMGFRASAKEFLAETAIQVEMFPLFATSQGFNASQLRWLRKETTAGRCATKVLEAVVSVQAWEIAIARYRTTFETLRELFDGRVAEPIGIFPTSMLTVFGRPLRLICLPGDWGITDAHLALKDVKLPRPRRSSPGSTSGVHLGVQEYEELRSRIMGLHPAVAENVRRAGSFSYDFPFRRGRHNFACIAPTAGGIRLDAIDSNLKFVDRVAFSSVDGAVALCKQALGFLR